MGCTPTAVKDKTQIPRVNARPSGRQLPAAPNHNTSLSNLANTNMASKVAIRDIKEIKKNDLIINKEQDTPKKIERLDFENKQYSC
jgi:hypothetical protein